MRGADYFGSRHRVPWEHSWISRWLSSGRLTLAPGAPAVWDWWSRREGWGDDAGVGS